MFLKSLRSHLKKYKQGKDAFLFLFLRTPLVGSKCQWLGMKLDEGTKLKTGKPVGNCDHSLDKIG